MKNSLRMNFKFFCKEQGECKDNKGSPIHTKTQNVNQNILPLHHESSRYP